MKNGKKLPTTTVTQSRVGLFQPTQRPEYRRGEWFETAWGRCRVTGRLGQRHADVFESIFFHADQYRKIGDKLELLVDPALIRKALSDQRYSGAGLYAILTELTAAVVEIDDRNGNEWPAVGHLIDTHRKSDTQKKIDPLTGEERLLVVIEIGSAAKTLIEKDINQWRNPAPIARLKVGISQAAARFILSHRHDGQRWPIDTVLDAVGAGTGQKRRDRKRELLKDRESLSAVGVGIDDENNFFRID